jgi:hypothetical protein
LSLKFCVERNEFRRHRAYFDVNDDMLRKAVELV